MTAAEWAGLAEDPYVPMRIVAAPAAGVFRVPPSAATLGKQIRIGQMVGFIERNSGHLEVHSPHAGVLIGLLVHAGERVRRGQPVAWVQLAA